MLKSNEEIEIIRNGARIADIGGEEIVKGIKEAESQDSKNELTNMPNITGKYIINDFEFKKL